MPINKDYVGGDQVAGAVPPPGAPREVAVGLEGVVPGVPAHARGNEQELMPLRAPGEPLSGAALIAAVGPVKAAAIERDRASAGRAGSGAGARPVVTTAAPAAQGATMATATVPPAAAPAVTTAPAAAAATPRLMRGKRPPITGAAVDTTALAGSGVNEAQAAARDVGDVPQVAPSYSDAVDTAPGAGGAADAALTPEERDGVISLGGVQPIQAHHKAGSDTDTPSRGLPRAVADKGKQITGGFGAVHEAQYFALDGTELRQLVEGLMDEVHRRLQDDLRFSIAVTYPRVRAKVQVIIDGVGNDQDFVIPKVWDAKPGKAGGTPLEIAVQYGTELCFVVEQKREEFDDAGASVSPPDAIREQLGISGPRKQSVRTPMGQSIVDVVTLPGR